ncbi:class I SAM-dependent methyltransferase [Paenibacillus ginsengarvi]|nr:class I SAM-dependent methyltransferase [Paenibacillus ginsengarvi]
MRISKEHEFLLQAVKQWFEREEQVVYYTNELTETLTAAERFLLDGLPGSGSVLDTGCGAGRISVELSRQGYEVTGIDVSEAMIAIARDYSERLGHQIRYVQTNGVTLPLADEQFDCVLAFKILCYIPTKQLRCAYMKELYRVLKPGGLCVMTQHIVPDDCLEDTEDEHFRSSPAARFPILEKGDTFPSGIGYVHWFTENGLLHELEDTSFEIELFRTDAGHGGAGYLQLIRLRKKEQQQLGSERRHTDERTDDH